MTSLRMSIVALLFAALFMGVLMSIIYSPAAGAAAEQYSWQKLNPSTNATASDGSAMSADGMSLYVPSSGERVVFYSGDGGSTWESRAYPATTLRGIAVSADGTKVVGLANNSVYISNDSAQTWSAAISVGCTTFHIDMSDDGNKLIVGCFNGNLYTSVNGGLNWSQRTGAGSRYWQGVGISADGSTMTAVHSRTSTSTTGHVYTSTDDGATWAQQVGAGARYWSSVDITADGSVLFATATTATTYEAPRIVFRSTDGGVTWTEQTGLGQFVDSGTGIVVSRDGQTVIATDRPTENPSVKVSIDGGQSWAYTQEFDFYYYARNISVSADGQDMLMPSGQGPVVLSNDQGASWNQASGLRSIEVGWTDVATTIDGARAWISNWWPSGPLQYSADKGDTWTGLDAMGSKDLDGVASSADGTYITTAGGCSWAETFLLVSSDGGTSWQQRMTDQTRSWDQISMSADGRVQIATECNGYIYVSEDYGQTWVTRMSDSTRAWTDVAVSADGERLVATVWEGGIYISNDSGATWGLTTAGTHRFYRAAMSADGERIVVGTRSGAVGEGLLYMSDDGGDTWQTVDSLTSLGWQGVAISADGSHIAAATQTSAVDPGIYVSNDGGETWELQATPPANQYELAMSADGSILYALSTWGDEMYRGEKQSPIAQTLKISSTFGVGSNTIDGTATPGVAVVATFPEGQQAEDDTDIFGTFSIQIPVGVSLKAGDTVTLQERSAAGVLGTQTTLVAVSDATGGAPSADDPLLADTGFSATLALVAALTAMILGLASWHLSDPQRGFRR